MAPKAWNRNGQIRSTEPAFPPLSLSAPQVQNLASAAVPRGTRKFKPLKVIDAATGKESITTNCLHCVKVFAGIGPCPGCRSSPHELQGFRWTGTSWNGDHRGYLLGSDPAAEKFNCSFQQACKLKNSLLRYQMEETKRMRVIDDSCDWYDLADDPWLSKDEREDAARRAQTRKDEEQKAKRHVFVDIDFSVGQIIDCTSHTTCSRAQKDRKDLQQFLDRTR